MYNKTIVKRTTKQQAETKKKEKCKMKRYNMNNSVKALVNLMDNDQINFECAVQRNKVWDIEKKTLLIH